MREKILMKKQIKDKIEKTYKNLFKESKERKSPKHFPNVRNGGC